MLSEIHENAIYEVNGVDHFNKGDFDLDFEFNKNAEVVDTSQGFVLLNDERKIEVLDFMESAKFISPSVTKDEALKSFAQSIQTPEERKQAEINKAEQTIVQPVKSVEESAIQSQNTTKPTAPKQHNFSIFEKPKKTLLAANSKIEFTMMMSSISDSLINIGYEKSEIIEFFKQDEELKTKFLSLYINEIFDINDGEE